MLNIISHHQGSTEICDNICHTIFVQDFTLGAILKTDDVRNYGTTLRQRSVD